MSSDIEPNSPPSTPPPPKFSPPKRPPLPPPKKIVTNAAAAAAAANGANSKEKTIEALNAIYARKPVPTTITNNNDDNDDNENDQQGMESMKIYRGGVTTTSTTKIITKNTGQETGQYRSTAPATLLLPPPSPLSPPLSPVDATQLAEVNEGVWFNMTDQYPVENFTGREDILQKVNDAVHGPKSRDMRPISRTIVLVGSAGIGKTEIARKFAFKFYVDCQGRGNVIWIDAESPKSIRDCLLELADTEFSTENLDEPPTYHNLRRTTSQKQFHLNKVTTTTPRSPTNKNNDDDDSPSDDNNDDVDGDDDTTTDDATNSNKDDDDEDVVQVVHDLKDPVIHMKSEWSSPKSKKSTTTEVTKTTRPKSMIVVPSKPKLDNNNPKHNTKPLSKSAQQKLSKLELETRNLEDGKIEAVLRNKVFQEQPTLFIFDNAGGEEDIVQYLPKLSPVGHIPSVLVTSVNEQHWNNSRVFKVPPFEILEAVDFLLGFQDIAPEFTGTQAHGLAKELYYYPPLLQRARKIVVNNLADGGGGERAVLRLEKNVGLVRRLKGSVVQHRELEIAMLSVDRGNFVEEDPFIRQHEGELRTHPLAMRLYQLEALLPVIQGKKELSILTVNEDAYSIAVLAQLAGPKSKLINVYDSEGWTEATVGQLTKCLKKDNSPLLKNGRVEFRLEGIGKGKAAKKSRISLVLEKLRAQDKSPKKLQYDTILTNAYDDVDLSTVRKLLQIGGRFVTSMSSSNISQLLKKNDPKKLEIKVLKQDFPELLVVVQKIL